MFVGPGDLSLSMGVPLQFEHPVMQEAISRVAAAVANHGKWWGTTSGTPAAAQLALDRGARMITAGGDHGSLVNGFKNSFAEFSKIDIR